MHICLKEWLSPEASEAEPCKNCAEAEQQHNKDCDCCIVLEELPDAQITTATPSAPEAPMLDLPWMDLDPMVSAQPVLNLEWIDPATTRGPCLPHFQQVICEVCRL